MKEYHPNILFNLAAQPIVRDSYKNPVYTYETNVMGTVNFLESVRGMLGSDTVPESVVVITTDKVYKNTERDLWGYREYEELDGYDPYSNSKSCAELAVHSYRDSFFHNISDSSFSVPISTARAGNVIGGGNFANDRIVPDSFRAIEEAISSRSTEAVIPVRNPFSTRPYQHVLEPLSAYLLIGAAQIRDNKLADWYNIGPDDSDCLTTGDLVGKLCDSWNGEKGNLPGVRWENRSEPDAPHEAGFLKLDSTKIKMRLGYYPRWNISECIEKTCEFYRVYFTEPGRIPELMDSQIEEYFEKR